MMSFNDSFPTPAVESKTTVASLPRKEQRDVSEKSLVSAQKGNLLKVEEEMQQSKENSLEQEDRFDSSMESIEGSKAKEASTVKIERGDFVNKSEDPYEFCSSEEEEIRNYMSSHKPLTSTPKKAVFPKTINPLTEQDSLNNSISDNGSMTEGSLNNSSFDDKLMESTSNSHSKESSLLLKAVNEIPLALKRARRCPRYCLCGVDADEMQRVRRKFWTKSYENRVEWFIDKVAECVMRDGDIKFLVEGGRRICGSCFRCLYRIDKNFYYSYLKKVKQGMNAAGYRRGRGMGRGTQGALRWLEEYGYYHADRMPVTGDLMLPYRTRKRDIYHQYLDEKNRCFEYSVSQSLFYDLWHKKFSHLKIKQTNSFSKCNTCVHLERQLEQTRDPAKRAELKKMISVHNDRQMNERRCYYEKREKARTEPRNYLSLIIDGMDQSKTNLPHFTGRLLKGVDPNSFLKTHIQGVINHGRGTFQTYIDINEYSHDSNMVMNIMLQVIHNSISKDGVLPATLFIQADNCARENKNKFVLSFCETLVRLSVFREVYLSFLQVGHTHEDIDAAFSQISQKLRTNEAETLPKLQMLLNGAKRVQGMYDIKGWLAPNIKSIEHHSKPLHYKFSLDDASEVQVHYKSSCSKTWIQLEESIMLGVPSGQPAILLPHGFEKIDLNSIRSNIEKHKYSMSGGDSQHRWWKRFLKDLEIVKSDKKALQEYAKENARWLLPSLVNKNSANRKKVPQVENHLLEMLDKELDDHKVCIKSSRNKKTYTNQRQNSKKQEKKKMTKTTRK